MKNKKKYLRSVGLLIIANLIPLVGVLFFDWSVFEVVLSYCLETFIIGLINIPKILMAKGPIATKLFLVPFFLVHYNGFVFIQLFFVGVLLRDEVAGSLADNGQLLWFPLVVGISHLISFFSHFVGQKEYVDREAGVQMFMPYGRIFIQQFTVIFGGMLIQSFGSPVALLVLLVIFKIIEDTAIHIFIHRKRQTS